MTIVVFLIDLHGGVFVGMEGADTHHGRPRPFEVGNYLPKISGLLDGRYYRTKVCSQNCHIRSLGIMHVLPLQQFGHRGKAFDLGDFGVVVIHGQ